MSIESLSELHEYPRTVIYSLFVGFLTPSDQRRFIRSWKSQCSSSREFSLK